MPIYEYRCEACGEDFQAIRRISDDSLPACKACGSEQVAKKISLSAFHLKGTGWYKTDYADKGKGSGGGKSNGKSNGESTAPSSSDSSSDAGAASDTKPSTPAADKKPAAAS